MALLEQWRSKRSWAVDGLIALGGASLGIAALIPVLMPPVVEGAISSPNEHPWEHPVRAEILSTLDKSPGIHFRELQRRMEAANGTLRHHLDVLVNEKTVTIIPVNGRTCYYAGAATQIEILLGTGVKDKKRAAAMLPVGLSSLQRSIVSRLAWTCAPESQAQLARDLGRSRSAVHSAICVLRTRGILAANKLTLADHLIGLKTSRIEYNWLDLRAEYA
jgi:DNA-binding transcriptional ArsR family regulator|tara:strand:+ start:486 stop:1142 length:657 start_codon:yes stop_codon:yes gene_type:complete